VRDEQPETTMAVAAANAAASIKKYRVIRMR
jgi:hypothetical protein